MFEYEVNAPQYEETNNVKPILEVTASACID